MLFSNLHFSRQAPWARLSTSQTVLLSRSFSGGGARDSVWWVISEYVVHINGYVLC